MLSKMKLFSMDGGAKGFFVLMLLVVSLSAQAASDDHWSVISNNQQRMASDQFKHMPDKYALSRLDEDKMAEQMDIALQNIAARGVDNTLTVPFPDGELMHLTLKESSMIPPELAAKYPEIKTFKAQVAERPRIKGVVGIGALGFHGMLFMEDGRRLFIDRREAGGEYYYISYFDSDYQPKDKEKTRCNVEGHNHTQRSFAPDLKAVTAARSGAVKRTYKIAIAATGEYTTYHGGTKPQALSAINTTLARVNEIYERDLAVSMTLVANNSDIIHTNASTDPYSTDPNDMLDENQASLDNLIQTANYDIGHVMSTGTGGIASYASVCNSTRKAQGMTGLTNPENDPFDIDFVAHEIGHQFAGSHSFNADSGGTCTTREARLAYEPGGGTTIMAYAGICGDNNIQDNSDAMFHSKSIEEMGDFIDNPSFGASCSTASLTGNAQPTADAGNNYTIPVGTPFELTGSGSDSDSGDTLTYSWEQVDAGDASDVNVDTGNNAIFRTFLPKDTAIRTVPQISDILAGTTTKGEILPTSVRALNFALVVRDQNGGVKTDQVAIFVDGSGDPFAITSHTTTETLSAGNTTDVTWNKGTTDIPPINCPNVKIEMSTDSGNTFSTTLSESTANDGTETVTIPGDTPTNNEKTRFKVSCVDNIFFDISDANLTIDVSKTAQTISFTPPTSKTFGDTPFTVSASSDSNLTVSISSDTPEVCAIDAQNKVTLLQAGICTLTASQSGNADYSPATSVSKNITVAKTNQTISFTPPSSKSIVDAPFTVTASSDSSLTVSISSDAIEVCTIDAQNKVTLLKIGTCTLIASQSGNDYYNPATSVSKNITVAKVGQTISFSPPTSKTIGDAPFTVTASSDSSLTVSISSDTTEVCTIDALNKVTLLKAGICTLTASQAGNAQYDAAQNVAVNIIVNPVNEQSATGSNGEGLNIDKGHITSFTSSNSSTNSTVNSLLNLSVFQFTVENLSTTTAETVEIKLTLPNDIASNALVYKIINGKAILLNANTHGLSIDHANKTVTFNITDNGDLDSDATLGKVVDPVAIGTPSTSTTATTRNGGGSFSLNQLFILGLILLLVSFYRYKRGKRA